MIGSDLSKQEVLYADPTAIQQINFTTNLDQVGITTMFFIIEEVNKRNCLGLFTRNCKSIVNVLYN